MDQVFSNMYNMSFIATKLWGGSDHAGLNDAVLKVSCFFRLPVQCTRQTQNTQINYPTQSSVREINYQLSALLTISYQLAINYQLSSINYYKLSTINYQQPTINHQLSTIFNF